MYICICPLVSLHSSSPCTIVKFITVIVIISDRHVALLVVISMGAIITRRAALAVSDAFVTSMVIAIICTGYVFYQYLGAG